MLFRSGIDFGTSAELIANGLTVDEVRSSIGADSLGYISLDSLVEASAIREEAEALAGLVA